MAINPLIPLAIEVPDIGAAVTRFSQAGQRTSQAIGGAVRKAKGGNPGDQKEFNEREQARLQSVVVGAQQVKPLLEDGNIEGALTFLGRRRQSLKDAGIDTSDTDEMIALVGNNPQEALETANNALTIGEQLGFIKPSKLLSREQEAQQLRLKQAGATQVNVNTKGAQKEAEKLAELRASRLGEIQEKAIQAEEQNLGLTQLENLDVTTGFGQEAKSQVARMFNALGVDGTAITGVDPANVQAFNSVTGKLVLDVMSTQKGPQTDRDQERIAKTLPSIRNEALANQFNINSLKAINFRRTEMRDFYEQYLEDNGTLQGVDRSWSDFKQKTPMLSDSIRNPKTGLPMFYHEFKAKTIERNPNATQKQILDAWRELN